MLELVGSTVAKVRFSEEFKNESVVDWAKAYESKLGRDIFNGDCFAYTSDMFYDEALVKEVGTCDINGVHVPIIMTGNSDFTLNITIGTVGAPLLDDEFTIDFWGVLKIADLILDESLNDMSEKEVSELEDYLSTQQFSDLSDSQIACNITPLLQNVTLKGSEPMYELNGENGNRDVVITLINHDDKVTGKYELLNNEK